MLIKAEKVATIADIFLLQVGALIIIIKQFQQSFVALLAQNSFTLSYIT